MTVQQGGVYLLEDDSFKTMLEMFIYETSQNIEQLEMCILAAEKANSYTSETINEVFRIMHTIKGSAAMMSYNNIATLAHALEDLFNFLRGHTQKNGNKCTVRFDFRRY